VAHATEMRTAKAVASTMDMAPAMAMATMAVATMAVATMTSAMPSSVASATLAERHARQQGRQNKNGNSNGWFGHGTLPAPLARRSRHHNDANGNRKFHPQGSGGTNPLIKQGVFGGQRMGS
jgi:hypothetical protein